ncbi:RDD family protein [Vallicoccus soli]|uniref:RDD family protein n=1 Tax=Vallicoccus soli TaxID=2339232 RepID=A0A3A3ZLD1_9ACTN|nr:RDD family protein [Vallicoccus soli]RJK96942.1 RDD family protein [Vallicoccus soli]
MARAQRSGRSGSGPRSSGGPGDEGQRARRPGLDSRQVVGSWLEGPRAAAEAAGVAFGYRGERLGLPETGPGSVAGFGRRLAALAVDWVLCLLVATLVAPYGSLDHSLATLGVLVAEVGVLTGTLGTSVGHRLLGLRVVRLDAPVPVGLARGLLRAVLIALVVPAAVWDRDGRGLHDKAVRTAVVRA